MQIRSDVKTKLHSYLNHVSASALIEELESAVKGLSFIESITVDGKYEIKHFGNKECKVFMHVNPDICWPLEIEIKGDISNTEYFGFNNIQFGVRLVSVLGGEAIVDCEGVINPLYSDLMVRIGKNKWETVQIPDEGNEVNESFTKEITRNA